MKSIATSRQRRAGIFVASLAGMSFAATQVRAGDDLAAINQPQANQYRWIGGGVVSVKPKYEGSNEYEAFGFPYIFPLFARPGGKVVKRFDFNGADDLRFKLVRRRGFEAGPLAGYAFGRDQDDADRLNGLGDVDGGVVLGGFAGYRIGTTVFDVSYHDQVSGDENGYQLRFGAEKKLPVTSRLTLLGRTGVTYASDEFMNAYFGVTSGQSASSGLGAFNAEGGIKDAHVELGVEIALTEAWMVNLKGRYARLLGDAADSPVIETDDQFTGSLGVTRKFNWKR